MFELITEQPAWYVILCVLLGVAYAWFFYAKDTVLPSVGLKRGLAVVRGVLVSLLAFLLLTPLIKTFTRDVEKPLIVLAQDNSESLVAGGDSAGLRTQYARDFFQLADRL